MLSRIRSLGGRSGRAGTPATPTLEQAVASRSWSGPVPPPAAVDAVARALAEQPRPHALVVGRHDLKTWTSAIRAVAPQAQVETVRATHDASDAHVRLAEQGPFDLVLDTTSTRGREQAWLFQRHFMHLRGGGTYVACQLVPKGGETSDQPWPDVDVWELLSHAQHTRNRDMVDHRDRGGAFVEVKGLAGTMGDLHLDGRTLELRAALGSMPKLREHEATALLERSPQHGTVIETLDPMTWTPTTGYRLNRDADPYVKLPLPVPTLTLRRYDDATCSRGQVVTVGNTILPDTYRRPWTTRMNNQVVDEVSPLFGRVREPIADAVDLPGAYFHLDPEVPQHFGHFTTEQMGRLWAWDRAKQDEPDLRLLIWRPADDHGPARLAEFERLALEAFGVREEDVHFFDHPVRPERLFSATSMFSQQRYVHPGIADVWNRIGDGLAAQAAPGERPRRIFVSRRPSLTRTCHNTAELEDFMRGRGFEVIFPEDHPLTEQVAFFRAADVVAGFAGSGLFSLALTRPRKQVLTISQWAYDARNEFLIAAAQGHDLTAVWSEPDVPAPTNRWSQEAFSSSFTFDFDVEGRYLARELDRLDS